MYLTSYGTSPVPDVIGTGGAQLVCFVNMQIDQRILRVLSLNPVEVVHRSRLLGSYIAASCVDRVPDRPSTHQGT